MKSIFVKQASGGLSSSWGNKFQELVTTWLLLNTEEFDFFLSHIHEDVELHVKSEYYFYQVKTSQELISPEKLAKWIAHYMKYPVVINFLVKSDVKKFIFVLDNINGQTNELLKATKIILNTLVGTFTEQTEPLSKTEAKEFIAWLWARIEIINFNYIEAKTFNERIHKSKFFKKHGMTLLERIAGMQIVQEIISENHVWFKKLPNVKYETHKEFLNVLEKDNSFEKFNLTNIENAIFGLYNPVLTERLIEVKTILIDYFGWEETMYILNTGDKTKIKFHLLDITSDEVDELAKAVKK